MRAKGRILFSQHFHLEAEWVAEYPNFILVIVIVIIIGITTIIINNIVIDISSSIIVNDFIISFTFK